LTNVTRDQTFDPGQGPLVKGPTMLPAIDVLRGITMLWVTLFHLFADTRGVPGAELYASRCLSALRSGDLGAAWATAANALAAVPSFRVDLFLFVTGLVLMLRPPSGAAAFLRRRMRAVLPSYWLGSLFVLAVVVGLAGLRAGVVGSAFGAELQRGSLLSRAPYRLEPLDMIWSFSIVGRFQGLRTMQLIAPSMWYVVLVLQAYCVFPALRALLARLGPVWFFLGIIGVTCLGRWLVFRYDPFPSFGPNAAVMYLLPFRLAPLAVGMVAARWATSLRVMPGRGVSLGLAGPAILLVLAMVWASDEVNAPETILGVVGPVATLIPALPGFWIMAAAGSAVPGLRRVLAWAGRHSISILIAQDALRFVVGTAMTLGGKLGGITWWLVPPYLAASLLVAWVWSPLPTWVTDRVWPLAAASPHPAGGDDAGE